MSNERLDVGQLVLTSSTPPGNLGMYALDSDTVGVVGDISCVNPKTREISHVVTAKPNNVTGVITGISAPIPIVLRIPGFRTSLLASLVAGATATRTGLTVVISATGHGIPASTYDGWRFFIPPTPSLPSGVWADSVVRTDTNTLTCTLPAGTNGADFVGESVNGGAAYTTETTIYSLVIPANTLTNGSSLIWRVRKDQFSSTNNKTLKLYLENAIIGLAPASTAASGALCSESQADIINGKLFSNSATIGVGNSATSVWALDFTNDRTLYFKGMVSSAGEYISLISSVIEVLK